MGPKGKGIKGKPSKQAKGRKRKEGDEGERERAISPQPVVVEAMEVVSDHEEEEQLGPEDDEVTGKQKKEKYEYDAAIEQRLVEFFAENDCFYNKGIKALLPSWKYQTSPQVF